MLPPSLRNEALVAIYGDTIQKFKIFRRFTDPEFVWKLIPVLSQVKLDREDVIYWKGDHADQSKIKISKCFVFSIFLTKRRSKNLY